MSEDQVLVDENSPECQLSNLVGLFGHSFEKDAGCGDIDRQFRVVARVSEQFFAIQFYSFLDGCPNLIALKNLEWLTQHCHFYESEDLWNEQFDKHFTRLREARLKQISEAKENNIQLEWA